MNDPCREIVIRIPCCCQCTRDMFPPDRPLIDEITLDSLTEDGVMQFTAVFLPADPTYKVTERTLHIDRSDGATTSLQVGDGTVTAFPFDVDPLTGATANVTLVDTNSAGDSAESNVVTISLEPPLPPVPGVPPAPTIVSITPGTQFDRSKSGGSFARKR